MSALEPPRIVNRFRGFLPVVVDVETGGINPATDALLEIAMVLLDYDAHGRLAPLATHSHHVQPFPGAVLNPEALAFNGIDPYHPFRAAIDEKEALQSLFRAVRQAVRDHGCTRAILVGHNPILDLGFLNAAVERNAIKRNPFHPFSSFDTASLAGLAFGQTVLARAVQCAGFAWDQNQAHSAIYDAERTAELFCAIVNEWDEKIGLRAQDPGLRTKD